MSVVLRGMGLASWAGSEEPSMTGLLSLSCRWSVWLLVENQRAMHDTYKDDGLESEALSGFDLSLRLGMYPYLHDDESRLRVGFGQLTAKAASPSDEAGALSTKAFDSRDIRVMRPAGTS
jgi:hypothetical protein